MNSSCDIPAEVGRRARELFDDEIAENRVLESSKGGIERPRDDRSATTTISTGPEQWFCLFHGDAGPMAIAVESVAEVVETDRLIRLAWSPPRVVGMCSYHREVV